MVREDLANICLERGRMSDVRHDTSDLGTHCPLTSINSSAPRTLTSHSPFLLHAALSLASEAVT